MVRGPFDETIFWNIRILKAREDNLALVSQSLRLLFGRPCCVATVRCPRGRVPVFAQALIGEGSRTSRRLRLNAMACKKAAN